MQIKKESLKENILEVARQEFFLHGYEDASLRVIAKKANTSLGNIYHYYENKEALLSCILDPFIANYDKYSNEHVHESFKITSVDELQIMIDVMDSFEFDNKVFKTLLSKDLVIFYNLKTTRYLQDRERLLKEAKEHIAWHLNLDECDYLVEFVLKLFLDGFVYMIKNETSNEQRVKEFKRMFKVFCSGIIVEANENTSIE